MAIKRKKVATRKLASLGKLSKRMTGVARGFGDAAAPGDDKCPQRCPEDRGFIDNPIRSVSRKKTATRRKTATVRKYRGR